MRIAEPLLREFDQEIATTRKTLARVPDDKFDFKPHETSMTLGSLANHTAEIMSWALDILERDSFNVAPTEGAAPRPAPSSTRANLVEAFDKKCAEVRFSLDAASDETMRKPWSLLAGDKTLFTMPRIAVWRSMIMNHHVHHRGQLTVYLRMNAVPIPSLYGPSGDEGSLAG